MIPRPPLKSEWIDLNRIWNLQGTQEKLLLIPRSHYVIFLHSVPQRKCKSISCYWGLCCARLARRDSRGWPSFRICVTLLALSRPSSLFSRAASAWVPGEHGGLPDVLETQKQHHHSLQPYATATCHEPQSKYNQEHGHGQVESFERSKAINHDFSQDKSSEKRWVGINGDDGYDGV